MTMVDAVSPDERRARLILVDGYGQVLGQLPPVAAEVPYWSEVESVVRSVREQFGVGVTIVRLLDVVGGRFMRGGDVSYLAELAGDGADPDLDLTDLLSPWSGVLDSQPNRHSYAQPGGARQDLAWAMEVLDNLGLEITGPPVQVRTWNLSSLWRIPIPDDDAWLKVVPGFFAHEGRLIEAMGPDERVPRLLGREGTRTLMASIPGVDLYDAATDQRFAMIDLLVDLQRGWIGREDELLELGLPDRRDKALASAICSVIERTAAELDPAVHEVLESFSAGLSGRLEKIAACGLPDTLVHGDFHSGNLRGQSAEVADAGLVLLDWSDAYLGNPLLDVSAFLDRVAADERGVLRTHWLRRWSEVVPGSEPDQAWHLLAPVAAARAAAVYQGFLDRIEPAERRYHASDPVDWLQQTAEILLRKEEA